MSIEDMKKKIVFKNGTCRVNMPFTVDFSVRAILKAEIGRMEDFYQFPKICSKGVTVTIHIDKYGGYSYELGEVYVQK